MILETLHTTRKTKSLRKTKKSKGDNILLSYKWSMVIIFQLNVSDIQS